MIKSLSICIPVYNWNINQLVEDLIDQCKDTSLEFEILVYDDYSLAQYKEQNQEIRNHYCVQYKELAQNIGRSKIRNLLASDAQFETLLFLDCDVTPRDKNFIVTYINNSNCESFVIQGGLTHSPTKDKINCLRWLYGTQKEEIPAERRQKQPYKSFKTSNFLITKSLFFIIKFDEDLKGYGHEDTFFGYELKKIQQVIKHINNPVIHHGLETSKEFIVKTEQGLINLASIYLQHKTDNNLIEDIKILHFIKNNKTLSEIFYKKWKVMKAFYLKNLLSNSPSLRFFDFYKLGFLIDQIKLQEISK